MTTTTWPRAQHWTTGKDGFRVSVLLYKTSRERCAACKTFPAMHFVSADGRGLYEGFSGCAHFCDDHRPPKGPLPPLDCQKLLRGGDVVIYEHLAAQPEHGCAVCASPGIYEIRQHCQGCDDPGHQATRQRTDLRPGGAVTHPAEQFHVRHVSREWWVCGEHGPATGELLGNITPPRQ